MHVVLPECQRYILDVNELGCLESLALGIDTQTGTMYVHVPVHVHENATISVHVTCTGDVSL